jgi:hypothetical protein
MKVNADALPGEAPGAIVFPGKMAILIEEHE